MWPAPLLVYFIKTRFLFMVNDGNDDKAELYDPANYNLENAVNVYFDGYQRAEDRMGGWFMSPSTVQGTCTKQDCQDNIFKSPKLSEDDTVFLLLHGNAKNRGAAHRIAAYKTFQALGFYTLTIDYRGYGDSILGDGKDPFEGGKLGESSVVEDALLAIRNMRQELGSEFKLILYGHSMGSGIATHAASLAQDEDLTVDGIILDSPFHSFDYSFKLSSAFYYLDYFLDMVSALKEADIYFNNFYWVTQIRCPIRILHAESDPVTPIAGAVDLEKDAKLDGKKNIELVRFTEEGLGHIGISTTKGFKEQIADFAQLVRD